MEAKLHRRVQRYGWDRAVQDYDRYFVPVLTQCSEKVMELLVPQPGERVLDVATGTGVAAFMAADRVGEDGEVVATDISEKMIDQTGAYAAQRGTTNMRFERADAEELPYQDASFDAVTCVLGLMFPAEPQLAIQQMYRVLKPGGRAAVCVWGRREQCGWAELFPITDARVESDVCPMFFQLGLPGALELAFETTGFSEITEERRGTILEFNGDVEVCAAFFGGGPVALAYARMPDEVREEMHREFLESVKEYRNGNGYAIPGEFVFLLARK